MENDPAPAIGRGLALLRILERDGRCSLEHVVAVSGFPKTSVLRLLTSLEAAGAVVRDDHTKRYRALLRLVVINDGGPDLRALVADRLPQLAQRVNAAVECYAWDGGMTMVDRCDPADGHIQVRARIGDGRDLIELDAVTQVACVWGDLAVAREAWTYVAGKRKRLTKQWSTQLLDQARETGVARDNDLNEHGILRHACPVLSADGRLLGALAVARTWVPDAKLVDRSIAQALQAAVADLQPV